MVFQSLNSAQYSSGAGVSISNQNVRSDAIRSLTSVYVQKTLGQTPVIAWMPYELQSFSLKKQIFSLLLRGGDIISEKTVGNYMRELGIKAIWVSPYKRTTIDIQKMIKEAKR